MQLPCFPYGQTCASGAPPPIDWLTFLAYGSCYPFPPVCPLTLLPLWHPWAGGIGEKKHHGKELATLSQMPMAQGKCSVQQAFPAYRIEAHSGYRSMETSQPIGPNLKWFWRKAHKQTLFVCVMSFQRD